MNYLHKKEASLWGFFITLFFTNFLSAQSIQGTVWLELPLNGSTENTYGLRDANETRGIANVSVIAYPGGATTTTATDGSYTLNVGSVGNYRVEFNWDNINGLQASAAGSTQNNTSVQFVSAPSSNVNLGLHAPTQYSQANPGILLALSTNGNPNGGGSSASTPSLQFNPYDGMNYTPAPTSIANFGTIGSVYGEAYQRESSTFFLAAFAKRHCGVKNDLGSIFKIENPTSGSPNISEYFSLTDFGFNVGNIVNRNLPANRNQPNRDADAFAKTGKVGLGDIEIDASGENLYIVNLFDKMLYKINIGNPAKASISPSDIDRFPITDPACTAGQWRPFALGLDAVRNVMLIGGICDASGANNFNNNANLRAYIYEFDLTTQTMGTTAVLDFPLNFTRGPANDFATPHSHRSTHWNPWISQPSHFNQAHFNNTLPEVYFPQPLFADIEVDVDGSLILGFRDIWGDRTGHQNLPPTSNNNTYSGIANGDMYRVWNNNGNYIMESNGGFPGGPTGCGAGNGDGPGGGEYYCNDAFINANNRPIHHNTTMGGLSLLPGSGQIASATMDPVQIWSGGLDFTNTNSGNLDRSYQSFHSGPTLSNGTFGKANSIGDIEFLADAAPIEIGNLVWNDSNNNGVQDAGETGIENVSLELINDAGTVIATATTNNNGNYIFSNASTTSTPSHRYNVALSPNENYSIRIPNASGSNIQNALTGLSISPSLSGQGYNATSNDSNGVATGNHVSTSISAASIPFSGANNHTFDFGFRAMAPPCPIPNCRTVTVTKN